MIAQAVLPDVDSAAPSRRSPSACWQPIDSSGCCQPSRATPGSLSVTWKARLSCSRRRTGLLKPAHETLPPPAPQLQYGSYGPCARPTERSSLRRPRQRFETGPQSTNRSTYTCHCLPRRGRGQRIGRRILRPSCRAPSKFGQAKQTVVKLATVPTAVSGGHRPGRTRCRGSAARVRHVGAVGHELGGFREDGTWPPLPARSRQAQTWATTARSVVRFMLATSADQRRGRRSRRTSGTWHRSVGRAHRPLKRPATHARKLPQTALVHSRG